MVCGTDASGYTDMLGVKRIIAKAQNKTHGRVLEKMGVDLVPIRNEI